MDEARQNQGAGYAYFLKKGFQTYKAIMILTLWLLKEIL